MLITWCIKRYTDCNISHKLCYRSNLKYKGKIWTVIYIHDNIHLMLYYNGSSPGAEDIPKYCLILCPQGQGWGFTLQLKNQGWVLFVNICLS
jgi:hypothetical protein